ncbi:2-hydroxy-3-oxopropionate reductase [Janthinobacterium sp. 344]|uniref:NAD(P)-dependent oxidoreductase n=1 Tax=Janthinobacterium sp. 344 TaxID=1566280 RepID=UPI00088DEB5A|nr:NAD(P)-dependent oxidoreductase [Janthinobacterium sp. 344]SDA82729.1 2-hydroxy-3-oxopropionate reductase [Janthinobacterium sp. 551a]SFB64091.1 2-hydroxy-3-oxopropionate reductase [Janthinobacterium sp. 344]
MTFSTKIAFLGIGLMGDPMARRLLQAGYFVTVWNRTLSKAHVLKTVGARVATTLPEAVFDADIVISMLEAGPVVAQLIADALPALKANAIWVDMSSTQQAEALQFHVRLSNAGHGFIDAPVSGGVGGAQAGTLAIMAGASAKDYARVEPILSAMGRPTLVGPAGSGQVAKLCNQLIVGGTLNIVAEALLLAQAAGADAAAVRAAIRGGFAESKILDVHGQRMLERNFVAGGQVKSQIKDMHNILAAAEAAHVTLPVTQLVTQRYESIAGTYPTADHAAALLALEALNPGRRLGDGPDQLS